MSAGISRRARTGGGLVFAETSVLCALYRQQDTTPAARQLVEALRGPLSISPLVLFECQQSVRLQAFRFSRDRTQGYPQREAEEASAALQEDLENGTVEVLPVDWPAVYAMAEELSARHTRALGNRALDILHVATALCAGVSRFLTLDARQAALARAAGLSVRPTRAASAPPR